MKHYQVFILMSTCFVAPAVDRPIAIFLAVACLITALIAFAFDGTSER